MNRAVICCCVLLLTTLQVVTAQQEWCQTILAASELNPLCEPVGNCAGLMCLLQGGNLDGSTASFQVRKCQDPVVVDLMITSSDGTVGYKRAFNRTQTVFDFYNSTDSGESTRIQVAVTVARNATHLNFSAAILPTMQLIPPVLVPLNTTECMCESLEDFASVIQSPFDHDCSTNSDCNGIRCELDIFGNMFFIDANVLPCIVPPAIEVLVENSQHEIISAAVFNRTEEKNILIADTSLPLDVDIIHRDYSMDIQASLFHILVGQLELFPKHTIILDRTNCSNAPTGLPPTVATVTNTDTTPTPPSTASQTCLALYEIVRRYTSEPFVCRLRENCDGFWCRLDILDTHYNISTQVVDLFLVVLDESGQEIIRRTFWNSNITVRLPKPDNTHLGFTSNLRGTTLGVKIDLVTSWPRGSQQRFTLLPYSEVPVETARLEWCQTILAASELNPLCEPVGNCAGLLCLLQGGNFDGSTASFQVRKCQDPVAVDLMITSSDGTVGFQREFNRSQTVIDFYRSADSGQGTTIQVAVTVARNATHLNFSAATLPTMQLIPPVLVPLNTTECMCESLEDFASIIQSPFEHDCSTNSDCNGISCELDIFGDKFFVDAIVLPCIVPPAIEVLVENSQHEIISAAVFNRTEERDILVGGTSLPLDVHILHRDYSMDIQASLFHFLVGRLELFPNHTIILDRTNCSNAPTGLPPTVATVTNTDTTPTPPSTASQTCLALYEIVRRYTSEPFVCRLRENCDGFWCRLDILDTHYNISIQVVDFSLVVLDEGGEEIIRWALSNSNITVELPKPDNTHLGFASSLRGTTLGVKIDLVTSWPRGSQQRFTLLPYSEVPVETAAPTGTLSDGAVKAIAATVTIIALLIVSILATVLVFGCVHYYKNRKREEQFRFKAMSYGDVKEKEAELDASELEPPSGVFGGGQETGVADLSIHTTL